MRKSKYELMCKAFLVLLSALLGSCEILIAQSQNPSPMAENTRAHDRVKAALDGGKQWEIDGLLPKPIRLYLPEKNLAADSLDLLIHFHGGLSTSGYAVEQSENPYLLAAVNLGHGSSAYEKPFLDETVFPTLYGAIKDSLRQFQGKIIREVLISGFSAGYGAARAILSAETSFNLVDGLILLDGLHTDYVPERTVLAEGGTLNTEKFAAFLRFAKAAIRKEKRFLITHSTIFPGTYASTTESTEYLINASGSSRKAVLKWGPVGMQQLSEVRNGDFIVLGFAGNTAPDHVDHLHGLFAFLKQMSK